MKIRVITTKMTKETLKEMENIFHKEFEYYKTNEVPRCLTCKKQFVRSIDPLTGKLSEYIYKPDCEHTPHLRIMVG